MRFRLLSSIFVLAACVPSTAWAGPLLVSVTPTSWTFQATDGTSNTILVGETLPYKQAANNTWQFNGGVGGTTVPINYDSN